MNKPWPVLVTPSLACLVVACACACGADGARSASPKTPLVPPAEMQRLLATFEGEWDVVETFERSELSPSAGTRVGVASFRQGPGAQFLIEDYSSTGSAGTLHAIIIISYDRKAGTYRFSLCAPNEGCANRGVARWDGDTFVNGWVEVVNGRNVKFTDSFSAITRGSFILTSEGITDTGEVKWRVITRYSRRSA